MSADAVPSKSPLADSPLASTAELIQAVRAGEIIVLIDDEDRENEGDLVFAADFVTPEKINFLARFGRGLICMPVTADHASQLRLAPMAGRNGSVHGTNFTVAIEAAQGVSTGISAADRAHTIRVASRPDAQPDHIVQPGHVFPLVAQPGGVLVRAGHTEACCDLARLAGLNPAAVLCEIMNEDGTMARLPDLIPFAQQHGLKLGTIADLIQYRAATETMIEKLASRPIQTPAGAFQLVVYRDKPSGSVHLALVHGQLSAEVSTLVRVHEPVSLLDLLDQDASGHSWPLHKALQTIRQADSGVAVLLNAGENNIDLLQRLLGKDLPQTGNAGSTRAAERHALRTYGVGAQILRDLGVRHMTLLAKPRKMPSMAGFGLTVDGYLEN